jgi:hypothetical protein
MGSTTHVWERVEITLTARDTYANPYTEVVVWVDLEGPGFARRVYGFWDGDQTYRVRLTATGPGEWRWRSGANQADAGLRDVEGHFRAMPWSAEELAANPCHRGMVRATANGHALEYADGTPCFLLGDTWWAVPTLRHPWYDDDTPRPLGPGMGFKDMLAYRKAQGYNCIALLAAWPAWANDGYPPNIRLDDEAKTGVRDAWRQAGTQSAKDMHNEGGRPFFFPGRVPGYETVYPDVERLNPAYFRAMDRKIDYLNAQGFIPFIEVARRDVGEAWKRFYPWPESYTRYIQYVWSRYQAHNAILSPIHYDWDSMSVLPRDYNAAANLVIERYGFPPFGTLISANAKGSTWVDFAFCDPPAQWVTLHQAGNMRDHDHHWYLTQIYREVSPPRPALNGEPYYAGFPPGRTPSGETEESDLYCRSGMYGSVLSGGLAGHFYGAQGLWGGDIEPEAHPTAWEALQWRSGAQMQHLRTFIESEGARYQELVPEQDHVTPNRTPETSGNRGWAYCARTPQKDIFFLYFEADCASPALRGVLAERVYRAQWFDPRQGVWSAPQLLRSDPICRIAMPPLPSSEDWGLKLVLES